MVSVDKIKDEIIGMLLVFGYENINVRPINNGLINIVFGTPPNEGFKARHRKAIQALASGYLSEFYDYGNNTESIILKQNCNGLNPDSDKYSCLIHTINQINDDITSEIFVNEKDHFKRIICNKLSINI